MSDHVQDEDCTLDASGTCTGCGVSHTDPCETCGGRGFHRLTCEAYLRDEGLNVGDVYAAGIALGLPPSCTDCTRPGLAVGGPVPCPNADLGCRSDGCARCLGCCCIDLAARRRYEGKAA